MFVFALAANAYADGNQTDTRTEDTVNVPFTFAGKVCEKTEDGKYHCIWDPTAFVEDEVEEVVPEEFNPDAEIIPDELVYPEESVIQPVEEEFKPANKFEADKERFETHDPASGPGEREYEALLGELATCQRGTQESAGVQQKDRYVVSTTYVNKAEMYLKSFDITGNFAQLKKAIEECKAQHTILEPILFGPEYLNRSGYVGVGQAYHSDVARNIVTAPAVNLTERDYFDSIVNAREAICTSDHYQPDTKRIYGCYDDESVDVDGKVTYISSAIHKYNIWKTMEHKPNMSVVAKNQGVNPISEFISSQGGYENAVDAINWQKHNELKGDALIKHQAEEDAKANVSPYLKSEE